MTRRAVAGLLLGATVLLAAPVRVSRATMSRLERTFDQRIANFDINQPIDLIGTTRGVYLDKYGAVFTTEVNLRIIPISPFTPKPTAAKLEELRQSKLARLPDLRRLMRDMMVTSATGLSTVPVEERIVVGVTLFHAPWEITNGLPSQIVMEAQRKMLVDYEAGRVKQEALLAAIQETIY